MKMSRMTRWINKKPPKKGGRPVDSDSNVSVLGLGNCHEVEKASKLPRWRQYTTFELHAEDDEKNIYLEKTKSNYKIMLILAFLPFSFQKQGKFIIRLLSFIRPVVPW